MTRELYAAAMLSMAVSVACGDHDGPTTPTSDDMVMIKAGDKVSITRRPFRNGDPVGCSYP